MNIRIMEDIAENCQILLSDLHINFGKECYECGFIDGLIKRLTEDEKAFYEAYNRVVTESAMEDIVLYITGNNTVQPTHNLVDAWAVWNEALYYARKGEKK
jgi:hypothetical protein